MRRDREVIDRETVIRASVIRVGPAQENRLTVRETKTTDRGRDGGAVRSQVAIKRAGDAASNGTSEIECCYICAGSLKLRQGPGKARAGSVREGDGLRRRCAITPLFARVSDIKRSDSRAGVVRQDYAPEKVAGRGVAGAN